jgi:hypothetical protein
MAARALAIFLPVRSVGQLAAPCCFFCHCCRYASRQFPVDKFDFFIVIIRKAD